MTAGRTERRGNWWKDQKRLAGVGAEKMAEGERAGKVEKGRTGCGRDEGRSRGRAGKGFAALGALDKGGVGRSVDEGSG